METTATTDPSISLECAPKDAPGRPPRRLPTRNRFAALVQESESEGDDNGHEGNRVSQDRRPGATQKHRVAKVKEERRKEEPRKEGGSEAKAITPPAPHSCGSTEITDLDDFVLGFVFYQVGDAAVLSRLRLVCQWWRAVIDAEERVWRALVVRDFQWRPSERKGGKGTKKLKNRMVNFQLLYANLYVYSRGTERKQRHQEREEQRYQAKLSAFLCKVLPYVMERERAELLKRGTKPDDEYFKSFLESSSRSLACTHPHIKKGKKETDYGLLCETCNLHVSPKVWQPDQYWEKNWPKLLNYRLDKKAACKSMAHRIDSVYWRPQ